MEDKEKVEGKNNCCEDKSNCCGHCMHGMHSMHGWCKHFGGKCHIIRKIIWIFLIIIAFCIGAQWGEMHSGIRGDYRFERGGMMDWGYNYGPKLNSGVNTVTGTATVDVSKTPAVQ